MKIFLSDQYCNKNRVKIYAEQLENLGFVVTSSWYDEPQPADSKMSDLSKEILIDYAQLDLEEIDEADWFVFFSVSPETPIVRGGRHVEFGYALATNKHLVVIGPRENIYHQLPDVSVISDWPQALEFLKQRLEEE